MRGSWLVPALVSLSCSGASVPGPKLAPSEVTELGVLPPGYVGGDELQASCTVAPRTGALRGATLGDVDCHFERLARVLRARAGELSARFVVDKRCRGRAAPGARLQCSVTLARPTSDVRSSAGAAPSQLGPAPSPAQVLDLDDPRPQDTERIRVSFEPAQASSSAALPSRAYDRVAETASAPVGRRSLGQVSARCESCGRESLRYALRVTAGRVGAGEVSAVQCVEERPGLRCVATAFVPWSS